MGLGLPELLILLVVLGVVAVPVVAVVLIVMFAKKAKATPQYVQPPPVGPPSFRGQNAGPHPDGFSDQIHRNG
ncbi:hypothetical protein [Aestuariimicrobium kwangyangense]|uniref:hypothetical protein n=1 Tax=Aestuariimicrobium kwangyangense TaxID=396389 RepID=UPI0003B63D90|nr:hypothetical protein [Aestuariimicrobium kwangyangense]